MLTEPGADTGPSTTNATPQGTMTNNTAECMPMRGLVQLFTFVVVLYYTVLYTLAVAVLVLSGRTVVTYGGGTLKLLYFTICVHDMPVQNASSYGKSFCNILQLRCAR